MFSRNGNQSLCSGRFMGVPEVSDWLVYREGR